jgi:hypothetical protein
VKGLQSVSYAENDRNLKRIVLVTTHFLYFMRTNDILLRTIDPVYLNITIAMILRKTLLGRYHNLFPAPTTPPRDLATVIGDRPDSRHGSLSR